MSSTEFTLIENAPSPLRLGSHSLSGRAFLAPMAGVTDAPFRRSASRLGAALVVSEMTACSMLATGHAQARQQIAGAGTGLRVVQLAGCEVRWMAEGARIAAEGGADVIDINMGCPAKRVTNGYSGSALMRDLDHANRLIDAVVGAVRLPVTLKMRLGWDGTSINAPDLARRAEAAGVAMITVHGRTRCQFYNGDADWRAIRAVVDAVRIPVVANGDILDQRDADAAIAQSGAAAVMVGRAALGRPWLVGHLCRYLATGTLPKPPSWDEQKRILLELYEDMLSQHGVAVGVRHARKQLRAAIDFALGDRAKWADELRREALTALDPAVVRARLHTIFDAAEEARAA